MLLRNICKFVPHVTALRAETASNLAVSLASQNPPSTHAIRAVISGGELALRMSSCLSFRDKQVIAPPRSCRHLHNAMRLASSDEKVRKTTKGVALPESDKSVLAATSGSVTWQVLEVRESAAA
jgi:hypothetical protein